MQQDFRKLQASHSGLNLCSPSYSLNETNQKIITLLSVSTLKSLIDTTLTGLYYWSKIENTNTVTTINNNNSNNYRIIES